ncbi:hypothetical protein ACVBEF_18755 [Glaciimonas sp. GG7]
MSIRIWLSVLFFSACAALTAHTCSAAEINFSSDRDFSEINLNIQDQAQANTAFVVLSVTLTPQALSRLEETTRNALQQTLMISLDGNIVSTITVHSVMRNPYLKLSLTRQVAHDVFPSLLATPVSSISLSGFSIPPWALGTWSENLTADAPSNAYATDEKLSISGKTLNAPGCKRANHTVVAASDALVELRIDRRNTCSIDEVAVSKMILTRTPEAARMVISLYAIGSDLNGPPTRESTYRRQ